MSITLSESPNWQEVLHSKAALIHQQIAIIQRWVEDAGGDNAILQQLSQPYYKLLESLYEEDFPIAQAIESSDLLIHVKGPAVDQLTPRLSLIAGIFTSVRKQVGSVAYAIAGVMNKTALPKDIDLGLAGFAKGSLYLGFSLPTPNAEDEKGNRNLLGEQDPLYKATREAIKTIGIVTRNLESESDDLSDYIPDPKVRDTALTAVQHIAPTNQQGVDSITVSGKEIGAREVGVLTPETRRRIRNMIAHPVKSEEIGSFEGIVREIDLDLRRFELRRIEEAEIEDIRCAYDEEYAIRAKGFLDNKLKVTGRIERSTDGRPRLVEAQFIEMPKS